MQNPLHAHSANQLIEEYIGTAYENVKELAKQLDAIVNLNTNLTDITAVAANLNTLNQLALDAENLASNLGTFNQDASNALSDLSSALATALNTFNTTSNESIEEYSAAANEAISNIEDITQANISDIYEFFTATGYINLYSGEDVPSLSLLNEIMAGWTVVGAFGDVDVELTTRNQIFIDDNGDTWRYTGDLPYTVPDIATSTDTGWFPHELNRPTLTGRLLFTDIANEFITADINRIQTIGYSTNGDKGAAYYKRVVSEPSHALKAQSVDGGWWELDEDDLYLEMAGGSKDLVDNYSAIMSAFDYMDDRIQHTVTGSSPRSYHGANALKFKTPGPYKFNTKIEVPKDKSCYFFSDIRHRTQLHYTGIDKVAILFLAGSAQAAYGLLGVDVKGGTVAAVGGANGGIEFSNTNLTQSRGKGLWLTDGHLYHDLDYPAVPITSFTATNPCRVTLDAVHDLTEGQKFGLTDCLGEERINGTFYAKVISTNIVELYEDSGLTTPFDGTFLDPAAFTSGLLTKGIIGGGNTINTVWVFMDNVQVNNCLEEGVVIESSTFLLLKSHRLRINGTGESALALDCNGVNFVDTEIMGIDASKVSYLSELHLRMRHNSSANTFFDTIRFGSEDFTWPGGPDNIATEYAPAQSKICLGPLDGTPANQGGSNIRFNNLVASGYHLTPATECVIRENASVNGFSINSGAFNNITENIIKEIAKEAGRPVGGQKTIGAEVYLLTSTPDKEDFFSSDGTNWVNAAQGETFIYGYNEPNLVITPLGAIGTDATVSVAGGGVEKCFILNITTGASTVGISVCDIPLSGRYARLPVVQITPGNADSSGVNLAGKIQGNVYNRILKLQTNEPLLPNTSYAFNINLFEPNKL